jgi:hypothetical protein
MSKQFTINIKEQEVYSRVGISGKRWQMTFNNYRRWPTSIKIPKSMVLCPTTGPGSIHFFNDMRRNSQET